MSQPAPDTAPPASQAPSDSADAACVRIAFNCPLFAEAEYTDKVHAFADISVRFANMDEYRRVEGPDGCFKELLPKLNAVIALLAPGYVTRPEQYAPSQVVEAYDPLHPCHIVQRGHAWLVACPLPEGDVITLV